MNIILDRWSSLCYRSALRECKLVEGVLRLDNPQVITIIRAILFLNDPFSLFFLHTMPDESQVLLFVAAIGDFTSGFKQSSPLPNNHPT